MCEELYNHDEIDNEWKYRGYAKEDLLSKTCYGGMKNYLNWKTSNCHFLHNQDPFLKLGPFQLEVYSESPYRVVVHDFLTEKEIHHIIQISSPHLSRERPIFSSNTGADLHRLMNGEESHFVQKTVQHWLQGTLDSSLFSFLGKWY